MLLYHLDGDRLDFTHIYAARCGVEHHLMGDALILRSPGAQVAFKATGPIDAVRSGPTAGLEYRCHGARQGWSVIVSQNNDLDGFAARIAACTLSMDTEGLQLTLRQPGEPDIALGWADGLSVAGAHLPKVEESAEPLISFTHCAAS